MAENFPILAKGKGGTKYKVQQAQNAQSLPNVKIQGDQKQLSQMIFLWRTQKKEKWA